MSSLDNVLSHLPNAKRSGKGWKAHCPAHEDRKPSLSVSQGDDGTVLIKCHAGCTTEAILAAIGLEMRDLFPPKDRPTPPHHGKPATNGTGFTTVNKVCTTPPHHDKPATKGMAFATANDAITAMERAHGNRSATWTYKNAEGEPVGLVVRWDTPDGKQIRPVARHADGWHIGAMQEPRPLYMLPEIAGASRVIVCEGEKCAEAARSIGFTATTSSGGSQAATKTDWWPLAGKEVWILPDNDMPGRQYAEVVADILTKLTPAPKVRIVELPDLAEGEDIADWIEAQGDAAEPDTLRGEIEIMAQQAELLNQTENDELDCQPFPVHALPEPIQSFVSAGAKAILCDPSYLALPLLTAIAAAIGNTRRLELKRGWAAPAILWTAVVGESGTAKTPSFTLVMRPVKERERKALSRHKEEMKRYEGELAHWEKEMTAWKREKESRSDPPEKPAQPHAERFLVSDTTIEALAPILLANPRGLLLARDELAGWFGSFDRYAGKGRASADSASWLSMFNAESIVVDRKSGIPRTIYVPHACICLTGGIQPAILQRALSPEHRESGLASRFLLACPPRKGKKWTEADIDPDAETKLVQLFEKLYELKPLIREDGEPGPVLVQLNAEAKMAWIAYYNSHAAEQSELTGTWRPPGQS
ncbi:MAG: DUF3987 domain-containing protein [Gemmataceae bacterium]